MSNDQVTTKETAVILELAKQCLPVTGDFVELGCYRGDTSVLLGKLLAQNSPNSQNCGKPKELSRKNASIFSRSDAEFYGVEGTIKPVDNLCKNTIDKWKTPDQTVKNQCKTCVKPTECLCKTSERHLWIYDSFAGLPEKTAEDASGAGQNFQAGELFVTKREVVEKIRRANLHNVIIKKAWFDQLTNQDLPAQIAFAFLDGDLYSSIKTSLKLVAPRLQKQGIMIVHDYNNPELPGSSRAVDEFLRAHSNYYLTVRHTLAVLQSKC